MIKEVFLDNRDRIRKSSGRSMPGVYAEAARVELLRAALSSPSSALFPASLPTVTRILLLVLGLVWEERHQNGEAEQQPQWEGSQTTLGWGWLPDRPSHHPPGGQSLAAARSGKGKAGALLLSSSPSAPLISGNKAAKKKKKKKKIPPPSNPFIPLSARYVPFLVKCSYSS